MTYHRLLMKKLVLQKLLNLVVDNNMSQEVMSEAEHKQELTDCSHLYQLCYLMLLIIGTATLEEVALEEVMVVRDLFHHFVMQKNSTKQTDAVVVY